ncbi:MAG: hypothetical protein MJK14_18785 [Rivularia sp. ALOHA_DT_140]|nr:hypothetical protein [Rivularia sp. ALOHA_DT_140]
MYTVAAINGIRDLQVINCPTVSQNFRAKPRRVVVSLDRATPTVGQFIFWIFLSDELI